MKVFCWILCLSAPIIAGTDPAYFLVTDRNGLNKVSSTGAIQNLLPAADCWEYTGVEVVGNHFYTYDNVARNIKEYTLDATFVRNIPADQFNDHVMDLAALTDGRFSLIDNDTDQAYFLDANGTTLQTVSLRSQADDTWQNLDHIQVGNMLYVAEDGDGKILGIDLTSYQVSTLKTIVNSTISGIEYDSGKFYYGKKPQSLYSFTAASSPHLIGTLPTNNLTNFVVDGSSAWMLVNFSNSFYRMNLNDGSYQLVTDKLNYPVDIEILPEPACLSLFGLGGWFLARMRRRG